MKKIQSNVVYGRLVNGSIEYFRGAYINVPMVVFGKVRNVKVYNPTEEQMNAAGWYRVVNVSEDGTDYYSAEYNCIYHYIGAPIIEEPIEEPEPESEETQEV